MFSKGKELIINTRHTGMVVRDLERSIRFYEAMGLAIWQRVKETGTFIDKVVGIPGVCLEWAKLKCPDDSLVELIQYHSHPDIHPLEKAPPNRLGCSHIAFTVHDVAQACDKIKQLGGAVVNPGAVASSGSVRVAYCHDPDGILIELVEEIL